MIDVEITLGIFKYGSTIKYVRVTHRSANTMSGLVINEVSICIWSIDNYEYLLRLYGLRNIERVYLFDLVFFNGAITFIVHNLSFQL